VLKGKRKRRIDEDLRELPTYTLPEAARFLGTSRRTLQDWFAEGSDILRPSSRISRVAMLSFRDLSEAYVLTLLTKFYRFRLNAVREMMERAKQETGLARPLIEADLKILFHSLILEKRSRGCLAREAIDLSGNGNLVFPELVDQLGKRIVRDENNGPLRLFPWRLGSDTDQSRPVSLDPEIVSGRLVVTGTRIPVRVLLGKRNAGSSDGEIARSYRISEDSVRKALLHIERPLHKKAA